MHKDERKKEKVLEVLRKTRKAFIVEYVCGGFILFLIILAVGNGVVMPRPILYAGLFAGLFAPIYAELSRLVTRYIIHPSKLVIITGIIKQSKKNVYFHPLGFVPDLNIKQGRIPRLLNYGTVYLRSGGQENTFEIKDVNSPQKVMDMVENLIDKSRVPLASVKKPEEDKR